MVVNTRSSRQDSPRLSSPTTTTGSSSSSAAASKQQQGWSHSPTSLTLWWMAISLPLVIWDTGYTLGRPHTMPGGSIHWPVWAPYKLYGEVDHIYGFKAYNAGNGFTSAQGLLNAVETVMYLWYLFIYFTRSTVHPTTGRSIITGHAGAKATLIGFSAAVMTLSKTVLYWANEYYSDFDNIGHNPLLDLITLWIIPKFVLDLPNLLHPDFGWEELTDQLFLGHSFYTISYIAQILLKPVMMTPLRHLIEFPLKMVNKLVLRMFLWFPLVRMIEPPSEQQILLTSFLSSCCSGAWLVGSAYMIASMGGEIVDGLAGHAKSE